MDPFTSMMSGDLLVPELALPCCQRNRTLRRVYGVFERPHLSLLTAVKRSPASDGLGGGAKSKLSALDPSIYTDVRPQASHKSTSILHKDITA
jgi:hypothetical protein